MTETDKMISQGCIQDYDIQTKGVHFLNIIDIKYDATSMTPVGFYHRYRTAIINNCARRDEIIHWNEGRAQPADEILGPAAEDHILLTVIKEIDPRLHQSIGFNAIGSNQELIVFFPSKTTPEMPKFSPKELNFI